MTPYRGGPLSHGVRRDSSPRGRARRVKKASQSLPPAGGKGILIIFCRGMYLTENTYQAASVRFVRQRRTNRARGRLQSFCQKRAKPFFDSLSSPRGRAKGGFAPPNLRLGSTAQSLSTSFQRICRWSFPAGHPSEVLPVPRRIQYTAIPVYRSRRIFTVFETSVLCRLDNRPHHA